MTTINRSISKGQLVAFNLMQDNVAASQTDVQLLIAETTSTAGNAVDGYVVPWSGEIVGIGWYLSAAGTAGQLTVGATINGTEDADTTQTITTSTNGYARVLRGRAPFSAGDIIGAELTTNSTWDGTTADLGVTVYALCYLDRI